MGPERPIPAPLLVPRGRVYVAIKSGDVSFACNVNKGSSVYGKQSTAKACAKHMENLMKKRREERRK